MATSVQTEDPVGTAPGEAAAGGYSESTSADRENRNGSSDAGIVESSKQAASKAKDAARAMDEAKEQATSRADPQREAVAAGLHVVSRAFRSMGDDLKSREQGGLAGYAAEIRQAMSGQMERAANYLRGRDIHQLVTDAEDFARRSPAVFIGTSFLLGLAVSRFLKSSRRASVPVARQWRNSSREETTSAGYEL
jgi:hypothetical protein